MSRTRWVRRLLALAQGRRLDRELDDEIAAHLAAGAFGPAAGAV